MVYDSETLVALHQFTPAGEERYRRFLEDEGTRIIYRAQHPFRYYAAAVRDALLGFFRHWSASERGRSIEDRIRDSESRGAGSIPAGPASENQFNNGAVSEMEYERDLKSRA